MNGEVRFTVGEVEAMLAAIAVCFAYAATPKRRAELKSAEGKLEAELERLK